MKAIIYMFVFTLFFIGKEVKAQSVMGTATMDANWVIRLEGSAVLTEYNTDVAAVGFKSEEQARKFFLWFRDNLFEFRNFDFSTKRVTVVLHPEHGRGSWIVAQWNEYLQNKANHRKTQFGHIPFK